MTENGGKIVILQHVLNGPLFYTLKAHERFPFIIFQGINPVIANPHSQREMVVDGVFAIFQFVLVLFAEHRIKQGKAFFLCLGSSIVHNLFNLNKTSCTVIIGAKVKQGCSKPWDNLTIFIFISTKKKQKE